MFQDLGYNYRVIPYLIRMCPTRIFCSKYLVDLLPVSYGKTQNSEASFYTAINKLVISNKKSGSVCKT